VVRVFLTGGTGFIGGEVARLLQERDDDVVALVRTPAKAAAALAGGVRKAVYVSTVAVFGNTRGDVPDEQWLRPEGLGFTSAYEQTKVQAHERALELGARGLPPVTVQPGTVYGPEDTSEIGRLFDRLLAGKLPLKAFPDLGVTPVHRDDVAAGILLALDKGTNGSSYVLAGEPTRMGALVAELARVAGRKPPRGSVQTVLLRGLAPFGRVVGLILGFQSNLRKVVASSDGVTFWASSDKAQRELGWTFRPLAEGLATVTSS